MRPWPVPITTWGGATGATLLWRQKGALHLTVVVKLGLSLRQGETATLVAAPEIARVDQAREGMLERPADWVPGPPGSEVLLAGHAYAPPGGRAVAVRLFVGAEAGALVDKTLHVYGDRRPEQATPSPFTRLPLTWARAAGGPGTHNPVGRPARAFPPNVVDPREVWRPAGFGPIAASWPPRAELAARAPLHTRDALELDDALPPAWFHVAPEDQRTERAIPNDAWIVIDGMHAREPRFQSQLPAIVPRIRLVRRAGDVMLVPRTSRLAIDMNTLTAAWTLWASVPVEPADLEGASVVAGIDVEAEEGDPESLAPDTVMLEADELAQALHKAPLPFTQGAGAKRSRPGRGLGGLPFGGPALGHVARVDAFALDETMAGEETSVSDTSVELAPSTPLPFVAVSAAEPAPRVVVPPFVPAVPAGSRPVSATLTAEDDAPSSTTAVIVLPPVVVVQAPPFLEASAPPVVEAPPPAPDAAPASAGPAQPASPVAPTSEPAPASEAPEPSGPRRLVMERVRAGEALIGMDLAGADLSGLDLSRAILADAQLTGAQLRGTKLEGARLAGAKLVGADLEGARLSDADLSRADLSRASLVDAVLVGADLAGAVLAQAQGQRADFSRAKLARANLSHGGFDGARFVDADLSDADLGAAQLAGADFSGARLSSARLVDARCDGASFDRAQLGQAQLGGASLVGASMIDAELEGARCEGADATRAVLRGVRARGIGLSRGKVDGACLDGADLRGADLSALTGEGAAFDDAQLDEADLRKARLPGLRARGASLRAVLAQNLVAPGADLAGAKLPEANLRMARLPQGDLSNAVLDGADLRDADLEGATLTGASRVGAKLGGAKLKGAID